MKRKIRLGILVLALAALVAYCLGGCGVTVEQILNVVAPSEAPTPDVNITFGSPLATAAEPLQLECGEIDGVFSPFWAESDGDAQIVKMTQLSLLAVAGNQSPSEISRAVNADGSVTVTIRLRSDIRFSDGEALTADDLIFTYYVLMDADYNGPVTVNTLPVRGLAAYWNGMATDMYAKYIAIYDSIYNGGKYDEDLKAALKAAQDAALAAGVKEDALADDKDVKAAQKALDEYDSARAGEIRTTIGEYWQQDAQAIVDYCMANYSGSIEMKTGYTKEETEQNAGLQVVFAMVDTGYGTIGADGALTGSVTGTVWDLKTAFPTAADLYQEMYAAYDGDAEKYWSIEGYDRANMLEDAQNAVIAQWAAADPDWAGPVDRIEGLVKVDANTVAVTLEYCDEAVLQTLCGVYVAPLHAYGSESLYQYDGNSFGFTRGDLSALRDTGKVSLGAGEYVFSEAVGKTYYLEPNANYWLGAPAAGAELKAG